MTRSEEESTSHRRRRTSIYAYDRDNLVAEANSSGTVVARYSQGLNDSFGKQTTSSGSLTNPFQYTARESDSETALYYNRARYHDPTPGRFVSQDPIGTSGGINLYSYAANEPIRRTDPFGLTWVYSQGTGNLYYIPDAPGNSDSGEPIFVGKGYAGHGTGLNDPSSQCVQGNPQHPDTNAGPLPQGGYTIGPIQNNRSNDGRIFNQSMRLIPDPNNDMCNRAGFLIHGSNDPNHQNASQGCIVLPPNIRHKIGQSSDKKLKVVP
jgi:RHS repeat-associated protein